jgi:hypothetical protein
VLGLATLVVSAVLLVAIDKLIGGTGTAGLAAATTAGNAAAVPCSSPRPTRTMPRPHAQPPFSSLLQ